tara:strand:- start:317 stop:472 length:156 start_codon:yes stop_codon:yes gene_type:complete
MNENDKRAEQWARCGDGPVNIGALAEQLLRSIDELQEVLDSIQFEFEEVEQ